MFVRVRVCVCVSTDHCLKQEKDFSKDIDRMELLVKRARKAAENARQRAQAAEEKLEGYDVDTNFDDLNGEDLEDDVNVSSGEELDEQMGQRPEQGTSGLLAGTLDHMKQELSFEYLEKCMTQLTTWISPR